MSRLVCCAFVSVIQTLASPAPVAAGGVPPEIMPHESRPTQPPIERRADGLRNLAQCGPIVKGHFASVQVNTWPDGCNILGDAANEPSLAISLTDPQQMVIGWRQFDSIESDYRKPGYAYSHNGGETWTFGGTVAERFGSDPVLAAHPDGSFYYVSIDLQKTYLYQSIDGGLSWTSRTFNWAIDKPWMTIDMSSGATRGDIYITSRPSFGGQLRRSSNGGATFTSSNYGRSECGTVAVGPEGIVYVSNSDQIGPTSYQTCHSRSSGSLLLDQCGGPASQCSFYGSGGPNPSGLQGQAWIVGDHSSGPNHGNVYWLSSFATFSRSLNKGAGWSPKVQLEPSSDSYSIWFSTMGVAPNGRIDVTWNYAWTFNLSEVRYCYSLDGGSTWTKPVAVTPVFESRVPMPPGQSKIGDYYHLISADDAAHLAYAATFRGGHDVYYLRIPPDCNANGIPDQSDAEPASDCSGNGIPDECERDCNQNGEADDCDILQGASADCSGNDIPDECELVDCNNNEVADGCDIASFFSLDCDLNTIPDECQSRLPVPNDCNRNCVEDIAEVQFMPELVAFVEGVHGVSAIIPAALGYPPGFYLTSNGDDPGLYHVEPDGSGVAKVAADVGWINALEWLPPEFTGDEWRLAMSGLIGIAVRHSDGMIEYLHDLPCEYVMDLLYIPQSSSGPLAGKLVFSCAANEGEWLYTMTSAGETEILLFAPDLFTHDGVGTMTPLFPGSDLLLGTALTGLVYRFDPASKILSPIIRMPPLVPWPTIMGIVPPPTSWSDDRNFDREVAYLVSVAPNYVDDPDDSPLIYGLDSQGRIRSLLRGKFEGISVAPRELLVHGDNLLVTDFDWGRVFVVRPEDFVAADCNANRKPDTCEVQDGTAPDCNANGRPDACDLRDSPEFDCNDNNALDSCEPSLVHDCNLNLVHDACDDTIDCDNSGIHDWCEWLAGGDLVECVCELNTTLPLVRRDTDEDGFWDECDADTDGDGFLNEADFCPGTLQTFPPFIDGRPMGDVNGDCMVNGTDLPLLVKSLAGPQETRSTEKSLLDFDLDMDVDLHDAAVFLDRACWYNDPRGVRCRF